MNSFIVFLFLNRFFKDFIYLFSEKGEGRKKGKHQCVVVSQAPPTGDQACNPDMCPDWESNQQPFSSQAGAQSTEPHHPGLCSVFKSSTILGGGYILLYCFNFYEWKCNIYFFFFYPYQRTCLEKEKGRERETLMWEKHQLVVSHTCPNQGMNPQPRYVPWLGFEPVTLWFMGRCSNQATPARAIFILNINV